MQVASTAQALPLRARACLPATQRLRTWANRPHILPGMVQA